MAVIAPRPNDEVLREIFYSYLSDRFSGRNPLMDGLVKSMGQNSINRNSVCGMRAVRFLGQVIAGRINRYRDDGAIFYEEDDRRFVRLFLLDSLAEEENRVAIAQYVSVTASAKLVRDLRNAGVGLVRSGFEEFFEYWRFADAVLQCANKNGIRPSSVCFSGVLKQDITRELYSRGEYMEMTASWIDCFDIEFVRLLLQGAFKKKCQELSKTPGPLFNLPPDEIFTGLWERMKDDAERIVENSIEVLMLSLEGETESLYD